MNTFSNVLELTKNYGTTNNGALTNLSTTDSVLDLFSIIGNRKKNFTKEFEIAYSKEPELAIRCLLWARDIPRDNRCGGAGERETSRIILRHIESQHPLELARIIPALPNLGRWDDLLIFTTSYAKNIAFAVIKKALEEGNSTCAKWMPVKGPEVVDIRAYFGMTPKKWRKFIVGLRSTVEQKMCAKAWSEIDYSHLPSLASSRYQKAFGRHDTERYGQYIEGLKSKAEGVKVNAGALYPYDVLKSMKNGNLDVSLAQWDALPNHLGENTSILPMVDVSGSMNAVNVTPSVTALDVSLSLGLYVAEKQTGSFKDLMLTFSGISELVKIMGKNVHEKMNFMSNTHWAMNTDLQKAFKTVLDFAKKNNVPQGDMPNMVLVLSDMEFDVANRSNSLTNFDVLKLEYEASGYVMPKIVFWNLNARSKNASVTSKDANTALVSGFSPAILKSILSEKLEDFSPRNIMMETLMQDRYDIWK